MKVNRDLLIQSALTLLNESGLEQLTLRRLGTALNIQPAALYWHFKSKEALLEAVAARLLSDGATGLLPTTRNTGWATAYAHGLRRTLLGCRDAARTVALATPSGDEYLKTVEAIIAGLVDSGFTHRQATVLLSTIYNYTLSFVMQEQLSATPGNQPLYEEGLDLILQGARLQREQN